ncbi:MAG: transglycosylase SLT domain-containing protein [Spirochaetales bacterium]|nr:transglycosylase SLT domain-containing protein [Spirochaetales bacterium]
MKLLKSALPILMAIVLSGCLSQKPSESEREELSNAQYESYLRHAVFGTMNMETEDPATTRERHLEYFAIVSGSYEIAKLIYDEAVKYNIEPELVFALVFNESSFNPRAVNQNSNSIDRGLFQLNSRSFPNLREEDFFKPEINVPLGVAYLRYCLDMGGNEVTALAMYNAGPNRVKDSRTPRMTLDYIHKIQDYKLSLEQGIIPAEFNPPVIPVPSSKSVKNITLLMEQREKIN